MLLMMVPAVVVRLLQPGRQGSIAGIRDRRPQCIEFHCRSHIHPAGAAVRLRAHSPEQAGGVAAGRSRHPRRHGAAMTAACAGGLFGAALWFSCPAGSGRLPRPAVVLGIGLCGGTVLAIYAIVGVIDVAGLSQMTMLAWHVVMAVIALIALRVGLQLALLHEAQEPSTGEPQLCLHCRNIVPDMAFCPSCGLPGTAPHAGRKPSAAMWTPAPTRPATRPGPVTAFPPAPTPRFGWPQSPACG